MAENVFRAADTAVARSKSKEVVTSDSSLGLDTLALVTMFLIVVTYHIQNPRLQFETQFGKAFGNATLQPVLAVVLVICAGLLIWTTKLWRTPAGGAAAVALAA